MDLTKKQKKRSENGPVLRRKCDTRVSFFGPAANRAPENQYLHHPAILFYGGVIAKNCAGTLTIPPRPIF